ncbi:MAG TPA: N-acetylmuramoyl-L-alanine amidase [Kofleriaceae bacterium]|nr:N-acetylmuramoyl-L-alanine amidase [Kofleriaceae bacterium]
MKPLLWSCLLLGLAGGCSVAVPAEDPAGAVQPGLDGKLEAAAAAADVPAALLKAIGYVETRWQMVDGEEHEGSQARYGVMGLGDERLARGAALLGRSVDELKASPQLNLDAAAALLAEAGKAHGASVGSLMSWQEAVGVYSGIEDVDARKDYIGSVYGVLRSGASEHSEAGELIAQIAPHDLPELRLGLINVSSADYAAAIWRPSPNYNARPAGTRVSMVIIHSCEGGYAGCWGWLRNSAASASAHYVVKEDGAEITQLVRESDRAWHISAMYRCSLNDSVDCAKNGVSSNHFTVGIEHGGFASQAKWPASQIESSAKLTCDITRDHGIVRDRNHIVAHGRLQPETRTDPGANWPWAQYIDRVRALCSDGPGTGVSIIVDSNNANNDATKAKIELAGTWTSSTSTPGYYGSGYWSANTEAVSAPATFWFYLAADGAHAVDAWWTAGTNRAAAAPFVAYNAAGTELGRVSADQRANGSRWNQLGTWNFTRGWNRVVLSRWTTAGAVVIADALRVR